MPECCLWKPGETSQLQGDTSTVLESPCVGRKKRREPVFPFAHPLHQALTSQAREESQTPAPSIVTPSHTTLGTRTLPHRTQALVSPTLQPWPPADGSLHSVKLALSPETTAVLDLPQCLSIWLLFITSFFFPELISFVLLFLSQHLLLCYAL